MNVTVFGGAQPRPGDPAYQEAYTLGRQLGLNGHTVLTGGYIGTMEAVSRGAAEAGAHVIGVTCAEIERYRASRANPWVKEERHFASLADRISALINGCDAALALPGGIGTLAEISLMWNQALIGAISPKPLIVIGPGWESVFSTFFNEMDVYIDRPSRLCLCSAGSVDEAVKLLGNFSAEAG